MSASQSCNQQQGKQRLWCKRSGWQIGVHAPCLQHSIFATLCLASCSIMGITAGIMTGVAIRELIPRCAPAAAVVLLRLPRLPRLLHAGHEVHACC